MVQLFGTNQSTPLYKSEILRLCIIVMLSLLHSKNNTWNIKKKKMWHWVKSQTLESISVCLAVLFSTLTEGLKACRIWVALILECCLILACSSHNISHYTWVTIEKDPVKGTVNVPNASRKHWLTEWGVTSIKLNFFSLDAPPVALYIKSTLS